MLIGDKVCLGPLLHGDSPLLFNWLNHVDLAHANGPYRPMDQTRFNEWFNTAGSDPGRVVFAIRQQGDLRLLGYVQISNLQPIARAADIGILIGDAADQGRGLGQEALTLAIGFCWRDLNLRRLCLSVVGDNPRAIQAYAQCGFAVEGVMRQAAYVDGQYHDLTIMGLLRAESWIYGNASSSRLRQSGVT